MPRDRGSQVRRAPREPLPLASHLSDGVVLRVRADRRSTYSFTRPSLREFPITDTELKLIAAAAIMGLSNSPKTG